MTLTSEQDAAIKAGGNSSIQACPGSGKTRVLVAKALSAVALISESPRSIGCITFTNAAVDEMNQRLASRASHDELKHIDIGTIHSFCLNHVFRPFRCRLHAYRSGYEILSLEDERARQLLNDVVKRKGAPPLPARSVDIISTASIDSDGNPIGEGLDAWLTQCISDLWGEYRKRGWLDFSLLLYESLQLLRAHPEIARSLSAKFSLLLIDEFQDTTPIQLEIFQTLAKTDLLEFFLVGDPNQSIYGFAGASPAANHKFEEAIGATALPLSGNFRSSESIVQSANRLIPSRPKMEAVGHLARYPAEVAEYGSNDIPTAVTERFLQRTAELEIPLGTCAVLAAWWTDLLPIARHCLREGIPAVGPGARPYKRGRLIVPLLENLANLNSKTSGLRDTQRALFRTLRELGINRSEGLEGLSGRIVALALRQEAFDALEKQPSPLDWIISVGARIDQVLRASSISVANAYELSAREVVADIQNQIDRRNLNLSDITIGTLGLFSDPSRALKLLTVHASKGREFDAVSIVQFNDGRFPHFSATTPEQLEEARRVAYVAITRPKKLLHFIVGTNDRRDRPSRFLAQIFAS